MMNNELVVSLSNHKSKGKWNKEGGKTKVIVNHTVVDRNG